MAGAIVRTPPDGANLEPIICRMCAIDRHVWCQNRRKEVVLASGQWCTCQHKVERLTGGGSKRRMAARIRMQGLIKNIAPGEYVRCATAIERDDVIGLLEDRELRSCSAAFNTEYVVWSLGSYSAAARVICRECRASEHSKCLGATEACGCAHRGPSPEDTLRSAAPKWRKERPRTYAKGNQWRDIVIGTQPGSFVRCYTRYERNAVTEHFWRLRWRSSAIYRSAGDEYLVWHLGPEDTPRIEVCRQCLHDDHKACRKSSISLCACVLCVDKPAVIGVPMHSAANVLAAAMDCSDDEQSCTVQDVIKRLVIAPGLSVVVGKMLSSAGWMIYRPRRVDGQQDRRYRMPKYSVDEPDDTALSE